MYVTELRTIAKNCAHDGITPDEILRDRLVLGLRDDKMRERLLRINDLTLEKAIDICKASEQTSGKLQAMKSGTRDVVSFVRKRQTRPAASRPTNRTYKKTSTPKRATTVEQQDCKYCGR